MGFRVGSLLYHFHDLLGRRVGHAAFRDHEHTDSGDDVARAGALVGDVDLPGDVRGVLALLIFTHY